MSNRTRLSITIIVALAIIVTLSPMVLNLFHNLNRPPVVITLPAGVTSDQNSVGNTETSPSSTSTSAPSNQPSGMIYVHVAGAVLHPDVYKLNADSRVFEALKTAGGALPNADEDAINLAEPVHDGEKIYVPIRGESAQETNSSSDAENQIGYSNSSIQVGQAKAPKSRSSNRSEKLTSASQDKVDINTADADDLQKLPGVGPAMAARIIATRQKIGQFRRIDDLLEVIGLGSKKYAKISPFVKV